MNFENAKNKLKEYAQEHILDYYDELNDSQKEALLRQIDETDFSVTSKVINGKAEDKRGVITPIKAMTLTETPPASLAKRSCNFSLSNSEVVSGI